ncbi:hypothetical protein Mal64_24890 [Pseudobythopirellula maris]|uniref:DUF2383 domain-containing protein n=1 Tax=Pseudobythopirellula maris TaxID=2527991 RepID=A0A5C5ZPD1_9BACT|nr:hypothetical protein [Pseudobythopirellula maris]TWT88998.1 hypothetical protein Mal64_24890 [Pseudobythopirellula maris]
MAYVTIKNALEHVQKLRRQMVELTTVMADNTQNDYLSQLLSLAEKHDQAMSAFLADHMANADESVLGTWVQYNQGAGEGPLALKRQLEELLSEEDDDVSAAERVQNAMLELDQQVLRFYELIQEQVKGERPREFMEGLITMEEQKTRDKSRNYLEMQDL